MGQAEWAQAVIGLAADRERRAANAAGQLAAQLEALACIREAEFAATDTAVRNQLNADLLLAAAQADAAWRELLSTMRAVQECARRSLGAEGAPP